MKWPMAAEILAMGLGCVMGESERVLRPEALLLDMDGTLTRPLLDFHRIRADIGIDPGEPILESIARMDKSRRAKATAILERHEELAARESTLNAGAHEILDWARARQIGTAIITRNSRQSVDTVLALHRLRVDCVIAREDGPIKPDPGALFLACDRLGVEPKDAWMIGDGRHDIEAAVAAGIRSVWISHRTELSFEAMPWKSVEDLMALMELLESTRRKMGLSP
jgi:HAD superfamily hydrolase (TIGR01509 family)